MRILVADDLGDTREMLRLLLELRGHEVIEAANGQEAVERAVQERPDFVLMDLNMPIMDGFHATRRLREADQTCGIPIVALSAHAGDHHRWRAKALECGCDDYYSKPLGFEELDALLRVPDAVATMRPTGATSRE